MLIDIDRKKYPMKLVYSLSEHLEKNPRMVALAQNLTLDKSRPLMGLRGACGLFASTEWWSNINQGKLLLRRFSGIIVDSYVSGQDSSLYNNTIDLLSEDGVLHSCGIYVNDPADADLFKVDRSAEIVYALDELKLQPAEDGGINYLEIALEMAVSLAPVEH